MKPVGVIYAIDDDSCRTRVGRAARGECHPAWFASSLPEAADLLRAHANVGVVVADMGRPGADVATELSRTLRRKPGVVMIVVVEPQNMAVLPPSTAWLRWVPVTDPGGLVAAVRDAVEYRQLVGDRRRLDVLLRRRSASLSRAEERAQRELFAQAATLQASVESTRTAARQAARLVAELVERHDPRLAGHGERVARHASAMAEKLQLGGTEAEDLRTTCLLHGITLLGLPAASSSTRPLRGAAEDARADRLARFLELLPLPRAVVTALRHLRERWDGTGGPLGLEGAGIPLISRLVAVADVHVRLVTGAGGEEPMTHARARAEVLSRAGTELDPDAVGTLVTVLDREERSTAQLVEDLVGSEA